MDFGTAKNRRRSDRLLFRLSKAIVGLTAAILLLHQILQLWLGYSL